MTKLSRALLIFTLVLCAIALSSDRSAQLAQTAHVQLGLGKSEDYVGSEACKDCHEAQFKDFSQTSHAQLTLLGSWKEKATGCESCHGAGKAHIEEGDPKKIISFKNKSSKAISETCISCHAGREEHNSFR